MQVSHRPQVAMVVHHQSSCCSPLELVQLLETPLRLVHNAGKADCRLMCLRCGHAGSASDTPHCWQGSALTVPTRERSTLLWTMKIAAARSDHNLLSWSAGHPFRQLNTFRIVTQTLQTASIIRVPTEVVCSTVVLISLFLTPSQHHAIRCGWSLLPSGLGGPHR